MVQDSLEQDKIICSFIHVCQNYGIKCLYCKFNSALRIGNYLVFKDGKTTIRYLEDSR